MSDWEHVQQSIAKILMTPVGSRVMRRDFGSDLPDLVDAKMTRRNVLAVYSAAASAIAKWEPRFRMTRGRVTRADSAGTLMLAVIGTYYPRGHLGDYSVAQDANLRLVLGGMQ
nr:GPW/gp25 family protein [Rhizobium album]